MAIDKRIGMADLGAQYRQIKEQVDTVMAEIMNSGWFVMGKNVTGLEADLAHICDAKYGISCASGTDAIEIALAAAGVGAGDEVITSPFTFVATAESIVRLGAVPVFADINKETFLIEPATVEPLITSKTKAIMPVDLYGQMTDRIGFQKLANKYGLLHIIDGAQAIMCQQDGHGIALNCDVATLSFFPTKNLGAFGDGGMMVTNNDAIADVAKRLRVHGTGSTTYYYDIPGYCSRLDEIQAAVLRVKLPLMTSWTEARRRHADIYNDTLGAVDLVTPKVVEGNYHTYHQYTVTTPRREELKSYLQQNGVDSAVYYPHPLHLQKAYASMGLGEGSYPCSEQAANEVLSLPVHPQLTDDDIKTVATLIQRFF